MRGISRSADETGVDRWRPSVFDPIAPRHIDALTALLGSGRVTDVRDGIEDQLTELACCTDPTLRGTPAARTAAVTEILAGQRPLEYGQWVWYPWSRSLVHVLPCEEFRRVRTHHNAITRTDQRSLFDRCVAALGGSSDDAVACALAGIGGAFRLACGDRTVVCARRLFEIDPYLDVEIHPDMSTEQAVTDLLDGHRGPVHLLIDAADTSWLRLTARKHARRHGIPVLATERAGAAALLRRMADEGRLSPAMADAIPHLDTRAVTDAPVADTARRILLGQRRPAEPALA